MTSTLQFSATENGLTRVNDGRQVRIFIIHYSPEIEPLVSLHMERKQVFQALEAGDFTGANGMHDDTHPELVRLYKQARHLTGMIEAEAKRLGIPRHMPFAR